MTDELEALFDQIADEQREKAGANSTPELESSTDEEPSEEELEALFDEISAETSAGNVVEVAAAQEPEEEEPSEEELEALFDELSAQTLNQNASSEEVANETTEETTEFEIPDTISPQALIGAVLSSEAGKPIYDRIGSILRQLHDSMRELGYDRALQDVATEVTDAKGRLEYVATLTEQAATRVLNSIDVGMPQQEEISKTARDLEQRWTALFEGNMDIDSFKQLAQDSRDFASVAASRADEEKARLLEIMMAQDFQDITGQVIKKVVVITKKLEQELAQLLRDNAPPEARNKVVDLMAGPDVPDKAMDQDDVDSLLANLGF